MPISRSPNLPGVIRRLNAVLQGKRHSLARKLRSPANPRDLEKLAKTFGRSDLRELNAIYAWHDGTRGEDTCFAGYYRWLPLQGALKEKRMLDGLQRDGHFSDWVAGDWWNQGWCPVCDFNGDLICVDVAGSLGLGNGVVFERLNSDKRRSILAPSVADWMNVYLHLTLAGPDEDDEDVWLDYWHGRKASQIRKQLLPGYPKIIRARLAK